MRKHSKWFKATRTTRAIIKAVSDHEQAAVKAQSDVLQAQSDNAHATQQNGPQRRARDAS